MRPFIEENWGPWENRDFYTIRLIRPFLNKVKDKWLRTYLAVYGKNVVQRYAMRVLGLTQIPSLPVNPDDPDDDQYAPYLVLQEQVMRESDYRILKNAAFHAPWPMNLFAFCRLTGYSRFPEDNGAHLYRTYSCGLKRYVIREDIEDLCREMIEKKGPFQRDAAKWLKELPDITDEQLAEMASEKTERSWDTDPDEIFHARMQPLDGYSIEEDLKCKICSIFDAYIMWKFTKRFFTGSGVVRREAMNDSLSNNLYDRFRFKQEPAGNVLTAIAETLSAAGRSDPELTPEFIKETAWNVSEHSAQHSYFLYMAHWYGFETEGDDDLALKMLFDAAERGHLKSYDNIVRIYSEGKYVHKNFRLALTWQEKKAAHYRRIFEEEGSSKIKYKESLRELGDLLKGEGRAKKAKQYYRLADELEDQ